MTVMCLKWQQQKTRDDAVEMGRYSNTYYGMHLCNINWDHHEAIYNMYAMAADCMVLQNHTTIWEFV